MPDRIDILREIVCDEPHRSAGKCTPFCRLALALAVLAAAPMAVAAVPRLIERDGPPTFPLPVPRLPLRSALTTLHSALLSAPAKSLPASS
jgi:hypothetical protein